MTALMITNAMDNCANAVQSIEQQTLFYAVVIFVDGHQLAAHMATHTHTHKYHSMVAVDTAASQPASQRTHTNSHVP